MASAVYKYGMTMHEKVKLDEAKYFYDQMVSEINYQRHFLYNLSAFLSTARSVLLYALEEVTGTPKQIWYDDYMRSSQVLSFFKEKRDANIHAEPVKVQPHYNMQMTNVVYISDSLTLQMANVLGIVSDSDSDLESDPIQVSPSMASIQYTFVDWQGTEDVFSLCQMYLDELERFVADGQTKGMLTK